MGQQRRRYSEEFKREAVKYVQQHMKSVPDIAEELNIPTDTLRKWVSKYRSFSDEEGNRWGSLGSFCNSLKGSLTYTELQ